MTLPTSPSDAPNAADIQIHAAQVRVPCADLTTSLEFFTGRLGFRVDLIFPADSPSTAVISGYGVCLRLELQASLLPSGVPLRLRLLCDSAASQNEMTGPDGVHIEFVPAQSAIVMPPATREFVLSRNDDVNAWGAGRAGMQYRDLIPGRLGGRIVASHIRIPDGGEVPDYVHFHRVKFQMIFCKAGWVRVVYEDLGPPFVMQAGDCVLQPPEIRHRVLEASPGLEVIEIGCPAVHDTVADRALTLPTARLQPDRLFGGQRFVRHIAAGGQWKPWRAGESDMDGLQASDTGIAVATGGVADVRVVRSVRTSGREPRAGLTPSGELLFLFVLEGVLDLEGDAKNVEDAQGNHALRGGDCCVMPAGAAFSLRASEGLSMLTVAL